MTKLLKAITRLTFVEIRDSGKRRNLVVTLYPGGVIGLRPAKTLREELVSMDAAYHFAIKQRVAKERAEKKKAKGR